MRLVITAVINVVCYRGIVDSTNVWLFDVHIYASIVVIFHYRLSQLQLQQILA